MTSRKGDTISWTSYNYPSQIEDGLRTYQYSYDAFRQKWKQHYNDGTSAETTYFAGRLFEKNTGSGDTVHRHHIFANGRAVALFVERTSSSDYTRYLTHDHLGSVDGVVQDNGTTTYVNESFSVFGERRDPVDWVGDPSSGDLTKIADTTDRGYTDHIMLEQSSLIHMNGRVYDAEIGRFLSPDPYIPDPSNTQSFNRYTYVFNNPMKYTDPNGFDPSCAFWCRAVISTALNFLFGGDDDPPPPPDFCKDNTAGCGGVSAVSASQLMPVPTRLPGPVRSRPCVFICKGGIFGIVFDFGGPGTGSPLILWGDNASENGEGTIYDQIREIERDIWPGGLWNAIECVWKCGWPGSGPEASLPGLVGPAGAELYAISRSVNGLFTAGRAAASAPVGWQVNAAWGSGFYNQGGYMTGIEHIMSRHAYNTSYANVSRFSSGTTKEQVLGYVDSALKFGEVTRVGGSTFVQYNFGSIIGLTRTGQATSIIQVIINEHGIIRTAFPF